MLWIIITTVVDFSFRWHAIVEGLGYDHRLFYIYFFSLNSIENDYNQTKKKRKDVYTYFSTLINLTPISSVYSSVSQGQTIPIIFK
jgi:hypothetical protein